MARSVRFATRADENRRALPDAVRRLVTDRILALAEAPEPGRGDDIRLVAPMGENSGLIMTFVVHGRYFIIIMYRIVRTEELWVQALERVYADEPPVPPAVQGKIW